MGMAINSLNVEKQQFDRIMAQLKAASLPLRLKLQSPPFPAGQKPDGGKRRKRRKQRIKIPKYATERSFRMDSREAKLPSYRSDQSIKLRTRETRDTQRSKKKNKIRRMSTGSSMILHDSRTRPTYTKFAHHSSVSSNSQYSHEQRIASDDMKEE